MLLLEITLPLFLEPGDELRILHEPLTRKLALRVLALVAGSLAIAVFLAIFVHSAFISAFIVQTVCIIRKAICTVFIVRTICSIFDKKLVRTSISGIRTSI